jgi:lysozyme
LAYHDTVGVLTIGYGHTKGVHLGQVATPKEVLQFLKADLVDCETCVNKLVTVKLNQDQFDALISFTFNLGCDNLQQSTLLVNLNKSLYDQVPVQMLRWNKAGGVILNGLTLRRHTEGSLFSTGHVEFGH